MNSEDKELLLDHEKLAEEKKRFEYQVAQHQKYIDDWQVVLSTPAGRRIVWDLLGGMGFQKELFHVEPLIMARNCGQYSLALALLKDIEEAMPGVTFRMQNEFRSAQANKDKQGG